MNFELFISRRIRARKEDSFSRPVIRVSIAGIALGLAVMLVAVAILQGFQKQVREKVAGFGAHIQITNFDSNNSFEPAPVSSDEVDIEELRNIQGVSAVHPFSLKAGIIKTDNQIHGVVLKGVDTFYDWSFFKERLTDGYIPAFADTIVSNEILISKKVARLLELKTGDDIRMYFISENITRGRKFTVCGIYDTGLGEFDDMYILGDNRHIQRLNQWSNDMYSGMEIKVERFGDLETVAENVYNTISYKFNTQTIRQLYPQIFDWIEIQDINVLIILTLMALVAGITMISTLLILILENTRTIGLLKAIGAQTASIRKVFIYATVYIAGYGLFWGNVVGLTLIFIQAKTGFIPLPEDSYFVSSVPVSIGIPEILMINLATLVICTLMMLIPSVVIRFISPVKALRFE